MPVRTPDLSVKLRCFTARLALAICLCGLPGCGTAQYETLLAKQIKTVREQAPWARFWDYTSVEGVPLRLRAPELFKNSYLINSPHAADGDRIDPGRVQPPFLKLPGFRMMFEDFYAEGTNLTPFYCYVAADRATPQQVQALAAQLLATLKTAFPASQPPPAWETVDCKTPEGGSLQWKRLVVLGDMPFDVDPGAGREIETRQMNATFELWLHESQGHYVLLGWRINTQWDKKVELLRLAPLTAGTVQIGAGQIDAGAPGDAPAGS